ncbi:protein SOB FIVE-LIKE 5-like isoform X1 [Coffea arabica]|uniref:Protein SOB FIVE-LIKE 5-like isoform X1 n=1 Tax=Coffea arabica TaxID=13443 RepID=A0ABM4WGR6_COFAR
MDCFLASTPKSECSSGCESGWTLYLGSSFISSHSNRENGNFVDGKRGFSEEKRSEEEEEDLSMVSDASSGPPHCSEEEDCMSNINDNNAARCFFHAGDATLCKSRSRKKQKTLENHCRMKKAVREKSSLLDDTASSPVFEMDLPDVSSDHYKVASRKDFNLPNNHGSAEMVLDFSQGYSTTHFEEESSAYHLQDQYGFFHSSLSGNYLPENQWYGSRGWQR